MEYKYFLASLSEILEVESDCLKPESDFREVSDYWSSLTGFALMIFIEEKSGSGIDVEEFIELKTVEDVFNRVNMKKLVRF